MTYHLNDGGELCPSRCSLNELTAAESCTATPQDRKYIIYRIIMINLILVPRIPDQESLTKSLSAISVDGWMVVIVIHGLSDIL